MDHLLPLKPVVFHILLALAQRDAHGYGVIQAVRYGSDGYVRLDSGTFYRHLQKLIESGFVAESDARPPDDDPRRGAYYRLTPSGRSLLSAEGRRLARVVATTSEMGLIGGEGTS